MTNIILNNLRYCLLKSLIEKISSDNGSFYFFYGNPFSWPNDEPSNLTRTVQQEIETKKNILAMKRICGGDIKLAIKEHQWSSGEYYSQYSDVVDLNTIEDDKPFFVITQKSGEENNYNYNIYLCLDNGSYYNESGEYTEKQTDNESKPNHTTGIEIGTDGYAWKFMFSISPAMMRKFTTESYIPIDTSSITNLAAIEMSKNYPGTLTRIDIISSGDTVGLSIMDTNGSIMPLIDIPICVFGDGDNNESGSIMINALGSNSSINIPNEINANKISGVIDTIYTDNSSTNIDEAFNIESVGDEYNFFPNHSWTPIYIFQDSAAGKPNYTSATGIARISVDGSIEALRIINPGSGYIVNASAKIVQPSAIGYAECHESSRKFRKIYMESNGSNYSQAEAYPIYDTVSSEPIVQPVLSPPSGHGSDPENELCAKTLIINMKIPHGGSNNDFTIENDFRSIGIIENPQAQNSDGTLIFNDGVLEEYSVDASLSAKTELVAGNCKTPVQNICQLDALVVGKTSGARARIVDVIDNNVIRIIHSGSETNTLNFIQGERIKVGGFEIEITDINASEYVPLSGNLLFINNREWIERNRDQIETFNFIFKL